MIDYTAVRSALVDSLADRVDGLKSAVAAAFDGVPALPALIGGMPRTDFEAGPTGCTEETIFPVAVVVARQGTSDSLTVATLDTLSSRLMAAAHEASSVDPTLSGLVSEWHPERAEFGMFRIGSTDYPACIVRLKIQA